MTFAEAAAFFERSVARIEPELIEATEAVMEVAKQRAQEVIGVGAPGWSPLKQTTIERKIRGGYGVPDPLKRTGQLKAGIMTAVVPAASSVFGFVGSDDPIAWRHEMGDGRVPPRPFLSYGLLEALPTAQFLYTNIVRNLFVPGGGR